MLTRRRVPSPGQVPLRSRILWTAKVVWCRSNKPLPQHTPLIVEFKKHTHNAPHNINTVLCKYFLQGSLTRDLQERGELYVCTWEHWVTRHGKGLGERERGCGDEFRCFCIMDFGFNWNWRGGNIMFFVIWGWVIVLFVCLVDTGCGGVICVSFAWV